MSIYQGTVDDKNILPAEWLSNSLWQDNLYERMTINLRKQFLSQSKYKKVRFFSKRNILTLRNKITMDI